MQEVSRQFEMAFDAWIESEKGRIRRASSQAVYRSIWNAFARSLDPGVSLLQVTSEMIANYLTSRAAAAAAKGASGEDAGEAKEGLTIRYQARVARLIEKVMEHHATAVGVDLSNVSPVKALIQANPELGAALVHEPSSEPDLEYLTEEEHTRLKEHLLSSCKADLASTDAAKWSDMRDRASMALQLGAGLTPSDVREITIEEIGRRKSRVGAGDAEQRYIRVPKNGKISERNVKIDPWAAFILDAWVGTLRDRKDNGLSLYVFPGALTPGGDGQWSKSGQHKQTTKVLASLGINGSSFMLRHTWAMSKLREGVSERQVAKWLGVLDGGEVMRRYEAALDAEIGLTKTGSSNEN